MRSRVHRMILWSPLFLTGAAVFVAVGGVIVRALWNWMLPPLFGWHAITFWQAIGLLVLCRILFGGLGMNGGGASSRARRRAAERWEAMTPEEREQARHRWCGHFGFAPPATEGEGLKETM